MFLDIGAKENFTLYWLEELTPDLFHPLEFLLFIFSNHLRDPLHKARTRTHWEYL